MYINMHEEEFQECQELQLMKKSSKPPTDDLLDFITSQEHFEDQLDQVLQTYQAYHESQAENETPHRQMNAHITYHVGLDLDPRGYWWGSSPPSPD